MTTTDRRPATAPLSHAGAYGLLALVIVLWGANWPVMKIGLLDISPLWFSTARMWMGAACLFAVLAATGRLAVPTVPDLPVVASVGLCQMAIFQPLVNFGLQSVEASRAVVLVYTTPLWVVPAAMLWLGEKAGRMKLIGLAFGILGIGVLFNPAGLDWSNRAIVAGSVLLMVAAMIWGIGILHIRARRWRLSPLQLTPWQLLFAGVILLPLAAIVEGDAEPNWSPRLAAALLYNGPVATAFCFWAATSISRALPAITSSLSFLGVPVMGMLLSAAVLGERLGLVLLAGFGLILCGVVLVNLADRNGFTTKAPRAQRNRVTPFGKS